MIDSKYFDLATEQIRLSHSYLLKNYIQLCNRYKHLKNRFKEKETEKLFSVIDLYFYDETGKINWDNICPLMPLNIEKRIKEKYNILTKNEIRLCCLLFFNISYNDIADILPYTQNSAHTIFHKIKQKTGINDITITFKKHLLLEKIE